MIAETIGRGVGVATLPLRWIERARGRRRLALIGLYLLLVVVSGVLLWRQSSLRGLPDIGDPFSVVAFTAKDVADGDNAWTDYLAALELLDDGALPGLTEDLRRCRAADWDFVTEELRTWHEGNRSALDRWRLAADKPTARPLWLDEVGDPYAVWAPRSQRLQHFAFLALMEAAKLEREGDFAGAWDWYRALLRNGLHLQRQGGEFARLCGRSNMVWVVQEVGDWVGDPRNDAATIRRAMADVEGLKGRVVPNSETLRAEYLQLMRRLDDLDWLRARMRGQDELLKGGWNGDWTRHLPGLLEVIWWLRREPERSRRVARIAFGNWLAHCDGLTAFRPEEAERYPELFVLRPKTVAEAYVLPSELREWVDSSLLWEAAALDQPKATEDHAGKVRAYLDKIVQTLRAGLAGRE